MGIAELEAQNAAAKPRLVRAPDGIHRRVLSDANLAGLDGIAGQLRKLDHVSPLPCEVSRAIVERLIRDADSGVRPAWRDAVDKKLERRALAILKAPKVVEVSELEDDFFRVAEEIGIDLSRPTSGPRTGATIYGLTGSA